MHIYYIYIHKFWNCTHYIIFKWDQTYLSHSFLLLIFGETFKVILALGDVECITVICGYTLLCQLFLLLRGCTLLPIGQSSLILLSLLPTFCSLWILAMTFPFSASMRLGFRVDTWVRPRGTCLSVPGLFHLPWWLSIPFMLSFMAGFHSFPIVGRIFCCVYAPHFHYVFICWWTFVSTSWLLCIVLT